MQCPFCFSANTEEISDDRYLCNECEEYFDYDDVLDEYNEEDDDTDDYL